MDLLKLGDLIDAAQDALTFIEGQRDYHTDPDSDIGEQVPNRACYVYHYLKEALAPVEAAFDALLAQDRRERAIDAAEHARGDR
ncbi:MAG TPA: hypothetical protein VK196_17045 [Magnetospirillum sp.]|nr:hypothetical protein [Magnetospirillum sp.]